MNFSFFRPLTGAIFFFILMSRVNFFHKTSYAPGNLMVRPLETLKVHPLSWLHSNNRLKRVHFVSVLRTFSKQLLLSKVTKTKGVPTTKS